MALTLLPLIDDQKCFQTVRELRWPEGVRCPHCDSTQVTKRGFDDTQKERQRYRCGPPRRVIVSLTISRGQFSRDIINRCESGFCASISWG